MKINQTFLLMMALLVCVLSQSDDQICQPQPGPNLIVNGDFQNNKCSFNRCIWNKSTFKTTFLPGWIAQPQIEIGKSSLYTKAEQFQNSWVLQLDANSNTCVSQKILNLKQGPHVLAFNFTSRQGNAAKSNTFSVQIKDIIKFNVAALDYNYHSELKSIYLTAPRPETWITFCGTGKSDGRGTIIDNIGLFLFACIQPEKKSP